MARWSIVAITCMAVFFSIRTNAWCGEIAPGLLKEIESSGPTREYAVIVKLKETIDHTTLGAAVKDMVREKRVKTVVQEIKSRTERSQQDIRSHLAVRERLGRVKKMKQFWIFNGIALTATAETIKELASRPDVAEVAQDRVITLGVPAPVFPQINNDCR